MKSKKLIMSIDFGGSLTKVIGGTSKEKWEGIGIEPEIIKVKPELIALTSSDGNPENRLWLKLGDDCYVLGHLAKVVANTTKALREPKAKQAVLKILGALAVFKEKYNLDDQIHLSLCCVLPPGEINDREELEILLRTALENGFESSGGTIEGKVTKFECRAEGTGLFIYYRGKRGLKEVNNMYVSVLMTGYRNLSVLNVDKGITSKYKTSELGFVQLLRKIQGRITCSLDDDWLMEMLNLWKQSGKEIYLTKLLNAPEQLKSLIQAIEIAENLYQEEIRIWLQENLNLKTEEIIIGGGTVNYLKEFFREQFKDKKIYFRVTHDNLPDQLHQLGQDERFEDIWCLWDYFTRSLK